MKLWRVARRAGLFKTEVILSVLAVPLVAGLCLTFFPMKERRQGTVLDDPVLALFHPVNMDWPTAIILYIAIFLAVSRAFRDPRDGWPFFMCFLVTHLTRVITWGIMPLDPPANIIVLSVPFLYRFSNEIFLKYLFFSWHSATCFILFLFAREKWLRWYLNFATLGTACCVLIARAHYAIDSIGDVLLRVFRLPFGNPLQVALPLANGCR